MRASLAADGLPAMAGLVAANRRRGLTGGVATRDQLAPYRGKRDFGRTPEPSGAPPSAADGAPRFVVQRHRARRLHYDLRFEIDGVLVSWAVPKGPTLDPKARRAAFHVEDHPIEYLDFEGVIPAGEYGGGDVIVWDIGTWQPGKAGDLREAVAAGELHADMYGQKLRGRFVLVRTRVDDSGREEWLLLHKHDEYAASGWDAEAHPRSVLSGRTNDEVKADPERLWRSDLPAAQAALSLHSPSTVDSGAADAVAELDALGQSGLWHAYGRQWRVADLDRVVLPGRRREPAVTRRDLLRYAVAIAPVALPYLTRRGWETRISRAAPDWVARGHSDGRTQLVIDEPAALVWAVSAGAVEWHAATAQVDRPDRPTYALIELDPQGATWPDVLAVARVYRAAFEHLGVVARAKLSGRGGLQLWVPIARRRDPGAVHAWVEELSGTVAAVLPDSAVRLVGADNAPDRTQVAPFSPVAEAGAPVSAPIGWDELDDPALPAEGFTIRTVPGRLAARGDDFSAVVHSGQALPKLR
jgi:bifunctional non-homologous end joining protein LigD